MAARSTANERPVLGSQDLEHASAMDALSSTYQLIGQAEGCNVREVGDQLWRQKFRQFVSCILLPLFDSTPRTGEVLIFALSSRQR